MATILFSALGTLVGGPLGGAIGALAGREIDRAIIGKASREGPRLSELAITTSSYGTPIPRLFGRVRVPGTIIWSTELVEHRSKSGGGKGRPSTVTYSYTASFAVALSSRPVGAIGRIWADGNLLRGAEGDLKSNGTVRLHSGLGDQAADPLIAAAEGVARCPAYRGLAYAVFEDLDLSAYGNRIPALSFEVLADAGDLSVAQLIEDVLPEVQSAVPLAGLAGYAAQGSLAETLATLDPLWPIACSTDDALFLSPEQFDGASAAMFDLAAAISEDGAGKKQGYSRKREPAPQSAPTVLRYYDLARDYQPGVQRAPGRTLPGEPATIELPATLEAATAASLIRDQTRRQRSQLETATWQSATLDPQISPGAIVVLPELAGRWRVREWEWRASGVHMALARLPAARSSTSPADPGRPNSPLDLPAPPTLIAAFELPWDGAGSGNQAALFAAVSSRNAGWRGAALHADYPGGRLESLGASGRGRATMGSVEAALPAASPLLLDRSTRCEVQLVDPAMVLVSASPEHLAAGANRALIGREVIQFAQVQFLGAGRWLLKGVLRGRGGTEQAISLHQPGETFVLLDDAILPLDPAIIGTDPAVRIGALGIGDAQPILAAIGLRGIARQPLQPVHGRTSIRADGTLRLSWTRRARGGWQWLDGVDVPLGETLEVYDVRFGTSTATLAQWDLGVPQLDLTSTELAGLLAQAPTGWFRVRQRGDFALSEPLVINPNP